MNNKDWVHSYYVQKCSQWTWNAGHIRLKVQDNGAGEDEGPWFNWFIFQGEHDGESNQIAEGGSKTEQGAKRDCLAAAKNLLREIVSALKIKL